jgi:ParB-like nuclease domain
MSEEYWLVERLKPYERNPRLNDKAVDQIRASIREFGFAVPILAKSDGNVIDGHLRLKGEPQRAERFAQAKATLFAENSFLASNWKDSSPLHQRFLRSRVREQLRFLCFSEIEQHEGVRKFLSNILYCLCGSRFR